MTLVAYGPLVIIISTSAITATLVLLEVCFMGSEIDKMQVIVWR